MGWKISLKVATRRDRHSGLPKRPITKYYLHNLQLHNLPLRQSYFPPWHGSLCGSHCYIEVVVENRKETLKVMVELYCATILLVKFIYSEKATKFYKISTILLTGITLDKIKVEISQHSLAFSEYMNFSYYGLHSATTM